MKIKNDKSWLEEIQSEYTRLASRIYESIQGILTILLGLPIMSFWVYQFLLNYQTLIIDSIGALSIAWLLWFIFWIIWFIFIMWVAPFIVYSVIRKIVVVLTNIAILPFRKLITKLQCKLTELSNSIEKNIHEAQDITEILTKIWDIQELINVIRVIKQTSILSKRIHYQSQVTLYSTTKWLIKILLDLRSDLCLRLTEQRQILEWAKSEVEKNLRWTSELEQVSELQKSRLDRQIEQFEELQRVLVKV